MSHTFKFGSFAKRKNSTLQPTNLTSFESFDVLFKNPTSLDNPTITLNHSGDFNYNYAVYGSNYYFVRDKVARNNDLWEVSLKLDSMATLKANILATTAYILYDATANTELPDNRLPMKTTKSVSANSAAFPFSVDGGCYILSLTGAHGSTGVYKVSANELGDLIDDLNDITDNIFDFGSLTPPSWPSVPPTGSTIETYLEYVADALGWVGDWIDYAIQCAVKPISQIFGSANLPSNIRECRFIPFNRGVTTPVTPVYLGTFETNSSLGRLITDTVADSATVQIPWQAADYRRRSPYTELYIYLPYMGMIRLSPENLAGQSSITARYVLGLRDGSLICTLTAGSQVIGQYSANVAASVPVGISNISLPRAAQSVIAAGANIASKNVAGVGMAAMNFADSVTPNFTCIGGLDGVAASATNQNITCYSVFHDTIAAPNLDLATIGAPTMCSKLISSLPDGFIQCNEAHVSAAADVGILEEVDSYLNSGFYKE